MPPPIPASASSSNKDVVVIRPTEAQLRYSQFHHQRRAQAVKNWIQELYQTPLEAQKDGSSDSSSDYNSSDTNTPAVRAVRKQRRPVISAGRRALLKRSRRKYRQRREAILKNGYRGFVVEDAEEGNGADKNHQKSRDVATEKDETGAAAAAAAAASQDADDEHDIDASPDLEDIFMTRPKRRRPQPAGKSQQDSESYKRFQAACHAMMMNIKTSHVTTPAVAAPTKRWKRSEQHIKAAQELQHSEFLDYKWGVRKRKATERTTGLLLSAYYHQNYQIMDRGASWMMHLPKHIQYNRDTPYYHDAADLPPGSTASGGTGSDFTSSTLAMRTPGPKKFNKLVAFVQQRLIEKEKAAAEAQLRGAANVSDAPKMRLRESHLTQAEQQQEERRTSRAKEIAESMEAKANKDRPNTSRIRQIAQSLEGADQTPTMKLKMGLEFGSPSLSSGRKSLGSQQRRARYVPRMRLRDFAVGNSTDDDMEEDEALENEGPRRRLVHNFETPQGESGHIVQTESTPTPKMTLRDKSMENDEDDKNRMSRTKELALAMEKGQQSHSGGKIKEMARSLEPDKTPKMKLKNDLGYEYDEKKVSEDSTVSPSKPATQNIAKEFHSGKDSKASTVGRPSVAASDFFAQVRGQSEGTSVNQNTIPENEASDDFFAKVRDKVSNSVANQAGHQKDQVSQYPAQERKSPSRDSDAASDLSRGSNLSGLLNRGRLSISALTTSLNTIAENHADKLPPEIKERASNVSGRVSDFFSQLRHQKNNETVESVTANQQLQQHHEEPQPNHHQQRQERQQEQEQQQNKESDPSPQIDERLTSEVTTTTHESSLSPDLLPSQSEDSHEALAAYRRKRETLSPDIDKTSESSSYHALPNQIRDIVHKSKASPALVSSGKDRFTTPTSTQSQSTTSHSTRSELSCEKLRQVHERVMRNSTLLGDFDQDSVIDTDDVNSDVDGSRLDPQKLASLMMSPDVLQKRLKQAIRAVEKRNWEQVSYLINANPWLAEMKELTTNQFLLHKLAFFGGGSSPAPANLCEKLIETFPSAVYKFDQDGNVPLHLAAAAGNLPMIEILGEKFEGGASIRNEDGMLPLHFTIASLADFASSGYSLDPDDVHAMSIKIVKTVLKFFPKAVAIADNVGNIPLHVAAECLDGGIGVDIVYSLLDEAERQLSDPFGARFRNKLKLEEVIQEDMSTVTMSTDKETDSSIVDGELQCCMVLNNQEETPLLSAIRSRKGWEIIEALLSGPDGHKAALYQDADKNNALHLLVGECQNATAAMSVLKFVPEVATVRNARGMLPIEMACMQMMPEEVILGIALVDMPFNIDDQNGIKVHEGRGGSWYFLTCESDDHMIEIVQEIVSICSFQQLRELCFMTDSNSGNTVIDRATPKCRAVLSQALRFLGRFEFVGNGPIRADPSIGFKTFDALDFGEDDIEGKRILLECYDTEEHFEQRVSVCNRLLGFVLFRVANKHKTLLPGSYFVGCGA